MDGLFGALIGLMIGSYGNSVVYRLPRKILRADTVPASASPPLDAKRSFCPCCHTTLHWFENVPLLSWLALRGKCRTCRAPIPLRYPALEAAGALLGGLASATYGISVQAALMGLAGLLLLWLTVIDKEHRLLPDALLAPLALIGGLAAWQGWFVTPADAGLGLLLGYGVLALPALIFSAMRGEAGMGGGDPKLLAVIGLWVGPFGVLQVLAVACWSALLLNVPKLRHSRIAPAIAFGPYLIAGATAVWLWRQLP